MPSSNDPADREVDPGEELTPQPEKAPAQPAPEKPETQAEPAEAPAQPAPVMPTGTQTPADITRQFAAQGFGTPSAGYKPPAPAAAPAPVAPEPYEEPSQEERYAAAHKQADEAFAKDWSEQNPFKTSFEMPATPAEHYQRAERQSDQETLQARRDAIGAQQEYQRDVQAQREAQLRGNGQQMYKNEATGTWEPLMDTASGRPLYHEVPWRDAVDAKGTPVQEMYDRFHQKQTKALPLEASPDITDEQMYWRKKDGSTVPAGRAEDLANSPNIQTARAAIRAVGARNSAQWKEAIIPIQMHADQAKDDFETAQAKFDRNGVPQPGSEFDTTPLQARIDALSADPKFNEEAGGFLSIGAKPTPANQGLHAQVAALQAQKQAIDDQAGKAWDSVQPGGQLYWANRQANMEVSLHRATAEYHATTFLEAERRAIIKAQALNPDTDATLQSILAKKQQLFDAIGFHGKVAQNLAQNRPLPAAPGPITAPGAVPAGNEDTTPKPPPPRPAQPTGPVAPIPVSAPAGNQPPPRPGQTTLGRDWEKASPIERLKMIFGTHGYGPTEPEKAPPAIGSEAAGTKGSLFTIPKAQGTGTAAGIIDAANEFASSLSTPENVLLLAATAGGGAVEDALVQGTRMALAARGAQAATLGTFTAQGAMGTVHAYQEAKKVLADPKSTRADRARAVAGVVLQAAMTAGAGAGTVGLAKGLKGPKGGPPKGPETAPKTPETPPAKPAAEAEPETREAPGLREQILGAKPAAEPAKPADVAKPGTPGANAAVPLELPHNEPIPRTEAEKQTHAGQAAEAAEAAGQVTPPAETPKSNANTTGKEQRGPSPELPRVREGANVPAHGSEVREGPSGQAENRGSAVERPQERVEAPNAPAVPKPEGAVRKEFPSNEHAAFIGHQEGVEPGDPGIDLYNLKHDIPDHPKGSTVSAETLRKQGIPVPGEGISTTTPPETEAPATGEKSNERIRKRSGSEKPAPGAVGPQREGGAPPAHGGPREPHEAPRGGNEGPREPHAGARGAPEQVQGGPPRGERAGGNAEAVGPEAVHRAKLEAVADKLRAQLDQAHEQAGSGDAATEAKGRARVAGVRERLAAVEKMISPEKAVSLASEKAPTGETAATAKPPEQMELGLPKDVSAQVKTGVVSGTTAEKWADAVLAKRAARKGGRTDLKGEAGAVEPGAAGEAAQILAAAFVKGTAHFERGLREFGAWSTQMIKDFGEAVKPHLQAIWDRVSKSAEGRGAPPVPNKPQPVPGQKGRFFRSLPDTERERNAAIVRQTFERRPQEPDLEAADAIIKEHGPEKAMDISMSKADDGVPLPVKSAIHVRSIEAADEKFFNAKSGPEKAKALRERQAISSRIAPGGTEVGQQIAMYAQLKRNVKTAAVDEHISDVQAAQEKKLGGDGQKALDDAQKAMDEAKQKAIDRATRDLNKALGREVPVDKTIWDQYRESATDRMVALVESTAEPPKEQAPLKEFTNRIVAEMRARIKPLLPEKPGAETPPPTAADMLKEAVDNKEKYADVLTTVRAEFEKRYGEGSPALDLIDTELANMGLRPYSDRLLTKAIKEAHKAMGVRAVQIAREHLSKSDSTAGDIADALVKDAGITGADATRLASDLTDRAKAMYAEEREKALTALKNRFTNSLRAKKVFNAVDKAVSLNNLGALSRADVHDAVVRELHLPEAKPETLEKIGKLADAVSTAADPAGKARATLDLATAIHRAKEPSRWQRAIDVGSSLWYAHMLSTAVPVKTLGDIANGSAQMATAIAANPAHVGDIVSGWLSGLGEGLTRAKGVMSEGKGAVGYNPLKGGQTKGEGAPYQISTLESVKAPYPAVMKYVPRAFRALEAFFYAPAREAYAKLAATKLLEGQYKGAELASKVKETLGVSANQFAMFKARAEAEGFKGSDAGLRIAQLVQEHRAATMPEGQAAAHAFGEQAVYKQEPTGVLGIVYRVLQDAINNKVKVAGIPILKPFLPFIRIPTNLLNESLNYTPVGLKRAAIGTRGATGESVAMTADDRTRLAIKSVAGSLLMGGLVQQAVSRHADRSKEAKHYFDVSGEGPKDYARKMQLQQTGWRPHSVKIGDKWYNYMYTPLAVPLSVAGNVADALRFERRPDEMLLGSRVADAVGASMRGIMDTPMLEGLSNLADFAGGKTSAGKVGRFLMATTASTVVPGIVRQIDQALDPRQREASTPGELAKQQIPFVRRGGEVRTDALGDPITYTPTQRFFSPEKADPLRQELNRRNIAISEPPRDTKIGNRQMTDKEYATYRQVSGQRIKSQLQSLLPRFHGMKDADVQKEVRRIEEQSHAAVRETITRMASHNAPQR